MTKIQEKINTCEKTYQQLFFWSIRSDKKGGSAKNKYLCKHKNHVFYEEIVLRKLVFCEIKIQFLCANGQFLFFADGKFNNVVHNIFDV